MSSLFQARPGSFIVAFACSDDEMDNIHKEIVAADFIKAWWNRIPRVYVLETNLNSKEFYLALDDITDERIYISAPIVGEIGGRMEFEDWKHLLNADPERLRLLEIAAAKQDKERNGRASE